MLQFKHIPVMLNEVLEGLNINPSGTYVDGTVGGGGHSFEIAKRLNKNGKLICFDRDENAIKASKERLKEFDNVVFVQDNFHNAPQRLEELGIDKIDGVLLDLGVSSHQIDEGERGFSFLHDGKLDMRMDRTQKLSAFEVVNEYSKEKLLKILYAYGEENNAKNIVNKIVEARKQKPIETTFALKDIVESAFPKKVIYGKGGVCKKTFQAIRIEVNGELDGLREVIDALVEKLSTKGRFAILTFHSLEDRIVKEGFKEAITGCICPPKTPICICGHKPKGVLVNRKPIVATEEELANNSRSSSAKLRVLEKL